MPNAQRYHFNLCLSKRMKIFSKKNNLMLKKNICAAKMDKELTLQSSTHFKKIKITIQGVPRNMTVGK